MVSGRAYLAAFAQLHAIEDVQERRGVARQGLAMLAQIAEREPAPLEGIDAAQLLLSVRTALSDGMLADLEWLSPAAGAIAMFELAQALPPGAERRELGRRVLTRLRQADRDTFVRLLVALARSSPKLLASENLRARAEVVLSAPLTAPGAIGELALGLLAQPMLAASWIEGPATGSLPNRRLAARLLAHGAREAVRRHDTGDRGGVAVLSRPGIRAALNRLLGDREALVWRFAGIARGLLAHVDSDLAAAIDRELRETASSSELRRASASAAAALERGGAASRWADVLVERAGRDPGVARGAILGLAGLAAASPADADRLATALIAKAPLDGTESLAELRREEARPLLPQATAAALAWTRQQLVSDKFANIPASQPLTTSGRIMMSAPIDDGRYALLNALETELRESVLHTDGTAGIGDGLARARAALDAGDITIALREVRGAVEEIVAAADWLERATDDDPIDRRHSMRLLRELDRELLADNTLTAVLALAPDTDPARAQLARAMAGIEAALLAREAKPETGPVAHGGLRIARLRALVRLLDGVRASNEADLEPRLAAVRQLMLRAVSDQSPLRRAVWAAMTRAGDALLRDGHAEVTDLLLAWTVTFPDDDFAIVREASMVPDIERAFDAYARLHAATWAAADPDDSDALATVVERIGEVADALPPEQSPRVESVRLALARFGNQLARVVAATSHVTVPADAIDGLAVELSALARRVYGARHRLGLPADDRSAELETGVRAIGSALTSHGARTGNTRPPPLTMAAMATLPGIALPRTRTKEAFRGVSLDEAVSIVIDSARAALPPALAAALERALSYLVRRPHVDDQQAAPAAETMLPSWVPLSRQLGAFFIVRPIGRGAAGSVLLAVRSDERARADKELVAIKVPDYSGGAARNLSEQEFESLFREEAGALLALPAQPNLSRFITFDASARPKPILVMEFVRGTNIERTLEQTHLDMGRAFAIIDGLLAGIQAMHDVQIAHLDVKPANVVLRDGSGVAVLVDFGLAGRRIRPGCGSAHYGAAEVWVESTTAIEPFPADVYAGACVAFELITNTVLMRGDTLKQVIDGHFAKQPGEPVLAALERMPRLAPLAQLLRVAVARDPRRRPSAARLRAGFAAIAPDLRTLSWPIAGI